MLRAVTKLGILVLGALLSIAWAACPIGVRSVCPDSGKANRIAISQICPYCVIGVTLERQDAPDARSPSFFVADAQCIQRQVLSSLAHYPRELDGLRVTEYNERQASLCTFLI